MALTSLLEIDEHTTAGEIREAVAAGADPNETSFVSRAPLHLAGDAEQTRALLQAGADPNVCDFHGWTPLHLAQNAEQTRALLEAGADPNVWAKGDYYSRHYSAFYEKGDNPRAGFSGTPLHVAQDPEQTKALLSAGAKVPDFLGDEQKKWVAMASAALRLAPQPDINPAAARALKSLDAASQAPEQPSMRQRRRC